MKLKKLLSAILCMSCAFNSISVVFAEDYCESHKNSKGGYIDERCANPELSKVWKNQVNFANVKNLGSDGDEEYYCFNFRALDDVFEERKLEPTDNLWKEHDALSKFCYPPFLNLSTGLKIGLTSLLGAIGGYFFPKSIKNIKPQSSGPNSAKNSPKTSPQTSPSPSLNDLTLKEYKPRRSIFPVCIGALISGLASLIGLYVNYDVNKNNADTERKNKQRKLLDKIGAIDNLNERNVNMLKLLLDSLENSAIMANSDMFCFYDTLNSPGTPFDWDAKFVGINYTKAELASFPEKFKEIASKIRKNLKENGKLNRDNEIVSKPDSGQRELGD